MCRMFFQCSLTPFNVDYRLLKNFIKSCHWTYFRKYNVLGHHGLGWGFAYLPPHKDQLIIKRDITPIYRADWKALTEIKTRFLLIHARKAYPWKKAFEDLHPIHIGQKYLMTHNGTIKPSSFPSLADKELETLKTRTSMDTRKYLCSLIDYLKQGYRLKDALELLFSKIDIALGANAFIFNSTEMNIVNYHNSTFNGRHTTLFLARMKDTIVSATTPLTEEFMEIPNKSVVRIPVDSLQIDAFNLQA